MGRHYQLMLFSILLLLSNWANAVTFRLPPEGEDVLGEVRYISTANESPVNIAQRYNLGVNSVVAANPGYTTGTMLSGGRTVAIPMAFILPPLPRQGIIINLPEMRMYYYPAGKGVVMTFPIGIGRVGKTIPIVNTAVARKVVNPTWIPPEDIREFNLKQGIQLPSEMGPGPDNPLGPYAIYLRVPTYLIHSTIFPESIGRRASFGCIRMNEHDIRQFFPLVTPGTPVAIVDIPTKVGWFGHRLYMQSYPPLEERSAAHEATYNGVAEMISRLIPKNQHVQINWQAVQHLLEQPDGIPHEIGRLMRDRDE